MLKAAGIACGFFIYTIGNEILYFVAFMVVFKVDMED